MYLTGFAIMVFTSRGPNFNFFSKSSWNFWASISNDGLEQPVAYASRSLQPAEQKYAQIEHEALAIIFAVKCFHQHVYGREFTLVTDHQLL